MGVLRFPNAVSDIKKFVHTFRTTYNTLGKSNNFGHDDMVRVLINQSLVSSSGAVGQEALRRSTRDDRTRDPLYNQIKMYSELYRMLGWLRPGTDRLHFNFTELSKYIGDPNSNIDSLVSECILCIVFPNPNVITRSGNVTRPFPFLLKIMREIGGRIFRDEMIISALSEENDLKDQALQRQVRLIKKIRGNLEDLENQLRSVSGGLQINTLRNYTRIPIGFIRDQGWAECEWDREIYGKSLTSYVLTKKGWKISNSLDERIDVRAEELIQYNVSERVHFNLLAHYSMLERCGWDTAPILDLMNRFRLGCNEILTNLNINYRGQILYSPYQQSSDEDLLQMKKSLEKYE